MQSLLRRTLPLLVLSVVLAACAQTTAAIPSASPAPSTPASPSETPDATPRPTATPAPTVEPRPTTAPTVAPAVAPTLPPTGASAGFEWGDTVRVSVNGLAVRRFPGSSSRIVTGMRYDAAGQAWKTVESEVRLDAGYTTVVSLGPIMLDGVPWYRLHALPQADESNQDWLDWDADRDGEPFDYGWVAGAGGGGAYLEFVKARMGQDGPAPYVFASGPGSFTSEPFQAGAAHLVGEYALATEGSAPCEFSVTIQPTGEVLVATSFTAAFEEQRISSGDVLPEGEYTIEVRAGVPGDPAATCPWSLALSLAQG